MKIRRKTALLYLGIIVLSWIVVGLGSAADKRRVVTELKAEVINEENNHFLNIKDIEEVVKQVQGRPITEVSRGDVNIQEIERALELNTYVRNAEAYREMGGAVVVRMELRKPVARAVFEDGEGFYLDDHMHVMGLTPRFSANVPLVRGLKLSQWQPKDSAGKVFLHELKGFLNYVHASEFLRSQISEVVVTKSRKLKLYPEMGNAVIEFGKPEHVARKFSDLEFFYRRVLNFEGWENYKSINLEFKDQIVAKK